MADDCVQKGRVEKAMQIEDITFTLKDGRSALIRSPREDDAQAVLEALRKVSGETDFLTRYPEEAYASWIFAANYIFDFFRQL